MGGVVFLFFSFNGSVKNEEGNTVIQVFFSNNKKDDLSDCSIVFPVYRSVSVNSNYIPEDKNDVKNDERLTQRIYLGLENLLDGPSESEKKDGFLTSINENVEINKIIIEDGKISVDFSKELNQDVAGSCRVIAIRSQIEKTLKQFSEIKEVLISVEGNSEEILQP
jgi:spore germination protein GerM